MNIMSPEIHQQLINHSQVEKRRKEILTPWGAPVMISYDHIGRHIKGSGVLGASISAWENTEAMLLDNRVWEFIKKSANQLNQDIRSGEAAIFTQQFDSPVGNEGICKKENLPNNANIWQEKREGYDINVTNAPAPITNSLKIMFIKDPNNPSRVLLNSAWAGSVESPPGGLSNPDWSEYVFYSENK